MGVQQVRDLQAVIEALAEKVHRAVAIDDTSIRLLAHTAHDERVDDHRVKSIMTLKAGPEIVDYVHGLKIQTAIEPLRIPGRSDLQMLGRLCVPIRFQGSLLGYLWLIDDDDSLTDDQIAASVAAANAAGEILFRNRFLDDLRGAHERQLVLDLIDEDAEAHLHQTDLDAHGLTDQLLYRVIVVDAPSGQRDLDTEVVELTLEVVLRRAARRLKHMRALVATRHSGPGYVLAAYRPHDDPVEQLREFGRLVRQELVASLPNEPDVIVGIGPQVHQVRGVRASFTRALGVTEICRSVREYAPVAIWEELGIYRILQQLPADEIVDDAIPAGLKTLLAMESDHWLFHTLETFLDTAGNVRESAHLLNIHRATLYYRLARIEEAVGMTLSDGQNRLALHLGVKLARLTTEIGPIAAPVEPPLNAPRDL